MQLKKSYLLEKYGLATVEEAMIRPDMDSTRFLFELTIAALERFKLLKQQETKMSSLNDTVSKHLSSLTG